MIIQMTGQQVFDTALTITYIIVLLALAGAIVRLSNAVHQQNKNRDAEPTATEPAEQQPQWEPLGDHHMIKRHPNGSSEIRQAEERGYTEPVSFGFPPTSRTPPAFTKPGMEHLRVQQRNNPSADVSDLELSQRLAARRAQDSQVQVAREIMRQYEAEQHRRSDDAAVEGCRCTPVVTYRQQNTLQRSYSIHNIHCPLSRQQVQP